MPTTPQNYANHTRWHRPFHFFVMPVLLINVIWTIVDCVRHPTWNCHWGIVVSVALVLLALFARTNALKVQDRVIRLEMRLRLRQILPPELQTRIQDLTHRQLVALRFASDSELPVLVREILDGKLTTSKEIKLRVKNWQGDWLRA